MKQILIIPLGLETELPNLEMVGVSIVKVHPDDPRLAGLTERNDRYEITYRYPSDLFYLGLMLMNLKNKTQFKQFSYYRLTFFSDIYFSGFKLI